MNAIQIIINHVQPRFTREYKDGVELRGINLDHARQQIVNLINREALSVEIFDTDVAIGSISIREIKYYENSI